MKKFILMVAMALGSAGAWAQTDVTSTYLDNAGFDEAGDFITTGVCTYAKDVEGNSADGSSLMSVTAWTAGDSGDAKAGAAFGFGTDAFLTGTGYRVPAENAEGNAEGGALGLGGCWDGNAYYTQELKKPLAPGSYKIEVCCYNAGTATAFGTQTIGIKEEGGTTHYISTTWTAGAWTTGVTTFEITEETAATFYLGATKVSGGSAASAKLFVDYVKISAVTALEKAQAEAIASLPAAGDGLFTMGADAVAGYKAAIEAATTTDEISSIMDEVSGWTAPILSGEWCIKNASAEGYLGTKDAGIVIAAMPLSTTFEQTEGGFYIKIGDLYVNMKGSNTWSMSADAEAKTAWTFALADGKYTIKGPNGLIGTDNVTAGAACYGNKAVSNNGKWEVSQYVDPNDVAAEVFMTQYESLQQAFTTTYNKTVNNAEYQQPLYDEMIEEQTANLNVIGNKITGQMGQAEASMENGTLADDIDGFLDTFGEIRNELTDFEASFADAVADVKKSLYAKIEDGVYYIMNVESGKFLSNGANWGTRSVLADQGIAYTVAIGNDGKYTLKSGIKGATQALRPSDGYNDQSGAWEIYPATDGGVYMFNGSKYFCNAQNNIPDFTEEQTAGTVWKFITADERKAMLAEATAQNPVDATIYITNPDFVVNHTSVVNTGWEGGIKTGGAGTGSANTVVNVLNVEKWNAGEFDFYQVIEGLPNGVYTISCQGYTRKNGATVESADSYEAGEVLPAYLYAGDNQIALKSIFAEADTEDRTDFRTLTSTAGNTYVIANGQSTAALKFEEGAYWNVLENVKVTDGTLRIGIKSEGGIEWVVFDSFRLTCTGIEKSADMAADGYATFCAPFEVEVPAEVKAYTVDGVEEDILTLTEVATIAANTPVVLEGSVQATVSGIAAAGTPESGLLTGVYVNTPAIAGTYVLQNQNSKVGFYLVETEGITTVGANKAYLTAPAGSEAKAFYFGGVATGIQTVESLTAGKAQIYDLNGRQLQKLQKGVNIVNGVKVLVK